MRQARQADGCRALLGAHGKKVWTPLAAREINFEIHPTPTRTCERLLRLRYDPQVRAGRLPAAGILLLGFASYVPRDDHILHPASNLPASILCVWL